MDDYAVAYPPGPWYDFWTGEKMQPQPKQPDIVEIADTVAKGESMSKFPPPHLIHPTLDTLPVYVRGGSILPMQPLVQSTDETPNGPLELRVYPGPQCEGSLYLDDGHTFRYKQGDYLRQGFTCSADSKAVALDFGAREGTWKPWWKSIEVVVYGWPSAQAEAKLSGSAEALKTTYDATQHALHIVIPDVADKAELRIVE
ncbi:MAG: DUF5110 domain-containing protein, partial [Terriglobia bacterium]|nr:DUF5110 domain-containing protein [Terriglobia bacterium]